MTFHVNDGGTWRQSTGVHVNDGGTWRTVQQVWVNDGGTWRQVFSATGPISAFGGIMRSGIPTHGASSCAVTFQVNGQVSGSGVDVTVDEASGGLWYDPPTTGVGSSYWIRATVLSGSTPSTGAVGSWLQLSSARSWSYASGGLARSGVVYFEIASDSGGSSIVASGSFDFSAENGA